MTLRNASTRLLLGAALAATGCHAPAPIEANVELATPLGTVRAVATEDGIVALGELVPEDAATVRFRGRLGDGFYDDEARPLRRSDVLALLAPVSSRPNLARLAEAQAAFDDRLFIEVRTGDHADLIECHLHDLGRQGDLLALDEGDFDDLVQRYAGAGVFAWRHRMLELVGVLNGVCCREPKLLAFVGLDEISVLLPESSDYFRRRALPHRADFEFGIPRDFEGERPAAADHASDAAADGSGDGGGDSPR